MQRFQINKRQICPPLATLDALSRSSTLTLGSVKEFLLEWLRKESELHEKAQGELEKLTSAVTSTETHIDQLKNRCDSFEMA